MFVIPFFFTIFANVINLFNQYIMEQNFKITVGGVLSEGIDIGIKNMASLVGATILWLLTIWIPYINVGTTIAMNTIPIELSKGKIISPLFIFESKYRRYMGEFFTLIGFISIPLVLGIYCGVIPGIVIAISWSLAFYILIDEGVSPGEAMVRSNKATYGYKWTIFFISLILWIALIAVAGIIGSMFMSSIQESIYYGSGSGEAALWIFLILLIIIIALFSVAFLGCNAVIYRNLTAKETVTDNLPTDETPAETTEVNE